MKALLISPFFPPQNAVASLRVHSFARALADEGGDVTVLTVAKRRDQRGLELPCDGIEIIEVGYALPTVVERLRGRYRSALPLANGDASAPARRVRAGGVLRRFRDRRGLFSAVRMPDVTDYWVKPAVQWCREHGAARPWDIIISSSGPYTAHLVALDAKRRGVARRWVADFRDLWSDNHVFRGLFPFTVREQQLERRCLAAANLVTTVSDGLKRSLTAKTGAPVEVIYNGFDPMDLDRLPAERLFADDGLVRLVYTGALYPPGQDPAPLLEALASLRESRPDALKRLRLVVAGHGCSIWRRLAEPRGVSEVIDDRGLVSRDEALRMQRDADALLLVDWPRPKQGVLTGKLFEYLAATAPILVVGGSDATPIAEVMHRSRRGHHLSADVNAIAGALARLVDDPESMRRSADDAFIATLSRQRQAKRLVDLVRDQTAGVAAP